MIRLATIFSGIGSIEWALKRMNLDYKIVFACDNGDIELKDIDEEEVRKKIFPININKRNRNRKIQKTLNQRKCDVLRF